MRNGQNKHRMRGRNRGGGGGGKNHNPLTRVYESNGPDVKIRGTANHIAEKYIQLARDATASGDPVAAENYYQHAEHYFRLIAAAQEQFRQNQPFQQRESNEDSLDGDDDSQPNYEPHSPAQPYQQQQPREQRDQPYQRDFQPRHDNRQPRHDRQERHDRQDRQPYHDNRQPQQQANGAQGDDVERLPSFITGAPAQAAAPQAGGDQEQQGDRFPLHRRRRRSHRGPRADMVGGEGGDEAQGQPPAGE